MNSDYDPQSSILRNPYKEVNEVVQESMRECTSCKILKEAYLQMQNETEQMKKEFEQKRDEFMEYLTLSSQEHRQKTVQYNNDLLYLKEDYNNQIFQLKERYEKAFINKEGTQFSINLLNQQLERRQEYLEKLRKMLQRKENQLLNSREEYLANLMKINNNNQFDSFGQYKKELEKLKADYIEGVKNLDDQKSVEIKLLQYELKDATIERDYYIKKFQERLNEREETNKSIYESQCNQIQNIIQVLNTQHSKQISFYIQQINTLEQKVQQAQSTISKSALQDLVLNYGSSIFWKEGLEIYKQYNVHDVEQILQDIKQKELMHSSYLTNKFQKITKTALVIRRYEKQFDFMRQLLEICPQKISYKEYDYDQLDKTAIQKKYSMQLNVENVLIEKESIDKQFYKSLSDLSIIQQKNQQIVNDKIIEIFQLQQINKELASQVRSLKQNVEKQELQKQDFILQVQQKQNRVIELQNHIKNENSQFTVMLQLKKYELSELISYNQKLLKRKDQDIDKLCLDLEYFQTILRERPSRDEDLKTILNLQTELEIKSERFEQLQIYIKAQQGQSNNQLTLNGEKITIDNHLLKYLSKAMPTEQSTKANSQISVKRNLHQSSTNKTNSDQRGMNINSKQLSQNIENASNFEENDLSKILQLQKLYTRSNTPQQLQQIQQRRETEQSIRQIKFSTIQGDKKNNLAQQPITHKTIESQDNSRQKSQNILAYLTTEVQEYPYSQYIKGIKKDIQQNLVLEIDNKDNNIFLKKSSVQQQRSQTPQSIRNRIISKKNNSYIKAQQLITQKLENSDLQKSQLLQKNDNDDFFEQINIPLTKSTPFIFKIKKQYSRSQTPQQIIRKE